MWAPCAWALYNCRILHWKHRSEAKYVSLSLLSRYYDKVCAGFATRDGSRIPLENAIVTAAVCCSSHKYASSLFQCSLEALCHLVTSSVSILHGATRALTFFSHSRLERNERRIEMRQRREWADHEHKSRDQKPEKGNM